MAVVLPGDLGAVTDEETGIAGELIISLRDDLDDQLLGDELTAGDAGPVQAVNGFQFQDDAAGIRGVSGLQCLQRVLLGFFDIGADFVVIGGRGESIQGPAGPIPGA